MPELAYSRNHETILQDFIANQMYRLAIDKKAFEDCGSVKCKHYDVQQSQSLAL